MTVPLPADPAGPLLAFGAALGLDAACWQQREEPEQLTFEDPELDRQAVAALEMDGITPLVEAYGDALRCRFLLGELMVLEIKPGIAEADLEEFRARTASTPTVGLDLSLDKRRLVERWLGQAPGCRLFLYLFPDALARLLSGPLPRLEAVLWGDDPASRVVILVPGCDIRLEGASLAIMGGRDSLTWRTVLATPAPDAEQLRHLYAARADLIRWQDTWLRFMTPLHLRVGGRPDPTGAIARTLAAHLATLAVLYTADRTAQRGGRWVSTYAGVRQTVEVPLETPGDAPDGASPAEAVYRLFEWIYEPRWTVDRLLLAQICVAQALEEVAPAQRYRRLLQNAAPIFRESQRQWAAFIAGKVEAYTDQVRALEDDVAATVQQVADQIGAIAKSLSDAMLAAVAALLASVIGAFFQSNFNAGVFRLGLIVYAVYVLCFPLTYTMLYQWQRYRTAVGDFELRRRRFAERLSPEQVEEIVGTRIPTVRARFERWFWITVAIYLAVILLALTAAVVVPSYLHHAAGAIALQWDAFPGAAGILAGNTGSQTDTRGRASPRSA